MEVPSRWPRHLRSCVLGLLSFNDLSLALTLAADPLALDRHTLWEKLTTFPLLPDPRAHTTEGVTSALGSNPSASALRVVRQGRGLPRAVSLHRDDL